MNAIDPIEITLDKPRKMLLTMGALKAAQRELNRERGLKGKDQVSIFEVINTEMVARGDDIKIGADLVSILLWASLIHEDPSLTIDQTDSFVVSPVEAMSKLVQCVNEMFLKGRGEAQEQGGDSNDRPLAQQTNGSISGPLGGSN